MNRTVLLKLRIIALFSLGVFLVSVENAAAQEIATGLQNKVAALLAQVSPVERELTPMVPKQQVPSDAAALIPSTFRFSRTLGEGSRGEDVRYLQILLNENRKTEVAPAGQLGGKGNETVFFGERTKQAVIAFQNTYKTDVLIPARLSAGNGRVGPLTRNKLNSLITLMHSPVAKQLSSGEPTFVIQTEPVALTFSFDELNVKTREALVNILCTSKRAGPLDPISGSGVMIDPRGVILTNAHVAQYFLLRDYPVENFLECTIRTGGPAQNRYRATLLYLSPLWIKANAKKITVSSSSSTGENDFALLLITDAINTSLPLPASFPHIPLDFSNKSLRNRDEMLAAAYPVGFLSGSVIQRDLYPSSAVIRPGTVYSFATSTPDIFSIGGSVIAQQGSSGGAVVNREGKLAGLIVTSTREETTGARDLNALTASHLNDSFKQHTGSEFIELLAGDPMVSAKNFQEKVAPSLRQLLLAALSGS